MRFPPREAVLREAEALRHQIGAYLEQTPYEFSDDEDLVQDLLERLARRKLATGSAFCPCRETPDDRSLLPSMVCPCDEHKDHIAACGHCFCGLIVGPRPA